MIIQNSENNLPSSEGRLYIKNVEHAALSGKLAENFGNENFQRPEPYEEIVFLAYHHDHGWLELDENPPLDELTGLPFNLVETPFEYILKTSRASPDFNERHSPFCGLISSMHSYGLYRGRYGLSDAISLDWVPEQSRAALETLLDAELARQKRLKSECADYSETGLFTAYKFLQFVDACALYFNMNPAGKRGMALFRNVPVSEDKDADIELNETEPGIYRFEPYPFASDTIELYFEGRHLSRQKKNQTAAELMKKANTVRNYLKITRN
ncbi:MAG: DUF3891 family protein [Gammaproteobacteria bacterium]|nr:DUF3891 family protein [Gammaproteobacteria bacterium]